MDLKLCPFCGGTPAVQLIPAHQHLFVDMPPAEDTWIVECGGCPAGFCGSTEAEVAAAWNRRAVSASACSCRCHTSSGTGTGICPHCNHVMGD